MATEKTHPFSSDRPIVSRTEDLLGRAHFADALAAAIRSWKGKDSLVTAIYGDWGTGKTSLKNMVLDALRSSKADCPEIAEFNPWQWAGQEQLANAFFAEIGKVLGRPSIDGTRKLARQWRVYGAGLRLTAYVATGVRNAFFGFFLVVAALGIFGEELWGALPSWLPSIVGYGFLILAVLTKWWGGFAEKLTALLEARSAAQEKGLGELKQELATTLKKLDRPVLVVIDDVDRLSGDEIRLLFQLIKANADFPNLVYLVLFQLDIVQAALDELSPAPGRDFLKKIIQVGLDIPRIERTRLERVLFAGLNRILEEQKLGTKFDQVRWANVFVPGLRPYFKTLRDVLRFLGTLEFHVGIFSKGTTNEVNAIDLIAIEALRVFEPTVYMKLHDAKQTLTSRPERETEKTIAKAVEEIMSAAALDQGKAQVKEILSELFPTIQWVFGGTRYGADWQDGWYRELRVCHPDLFDKYFYLAIPVGDIAQAEIERLLAAAGDRRELVAILRGLKQRGLLDVAMDRLEAYKQAISLEHAVPFVTALFDIGDDLPEHPPGFFTLSPDMHLARIVYWYLMQEPDTAKREAVLRTAVRDTTGLYAPIMRTSLETRSPEKKREEHKFLVSEEMTKELRAMCLEKIRAAAASGALVKHANMARILYLWRDWESLEAPREWVRSLVQSDEGLLDLLVGFLQQSSSQTIGDHAARTKWAIRLSGLEPFVQIEELGRRVASMKLGELSEKQKEALKQVQKALARRREGKPESDFPDDEE